jgi:predicted metal-dependent peptidase
VVTDGARIVYRYDLVAALERVEVRRLILHALAHVLLKHPERGGAREWRLWTAACDLAVDCLFDSLGIGASLRAGDLTRFGGKSAEEIYGQLAADAAAARTAASIARKDGMLPPSHETEDREDEETVEQPDDRWPEVRAAMDRATSGSPPPARRELEQLRKDFGGDVDRVLGTPRGDAPGKGSSEIDAARDTQVSWRHALARFMREPLDREWSFARPNRKHLWRGLYLPGPVDVDGARFVVAIDTSGSMSDRDLGVVLGEIDAIRRSCACELTVVQFDAAIHATAEFSRWSEEDAQVGSTKVMRVYGRGGTDLRLPFEWAEKELGSGRRISALVVCTDGFGPLPERAPDGIPVLFLLTPIHRPPQFGQHVVLRDTRV